MIVSVCTTTKVCKDSEQRIGGKVRSEVQKSFEGQNLKSLSEKGREVIDRAATELLRMPWKNTPSPDLLQFQQLSQIFANSKHLYSRQKQSIFCLRPFHQALLWMSFVGIFYLSWFIVFAQNLQKYIFWINIDPNKKTQLSMPIEGN